MRRVLAVLLLLVLPCPSFAQSVGPRQPVTMAIGLRASTANCVTADCAQLTVTGYNTVAVQIIGSFNATLTFEASLDGATWVTLTLTPSNSATGATTATTAGVWRGSISGMNFVRIRPSAYANGLINVVLQAVV